MRITERISVLLLAIYVAILAAPAVAKAWGGGTSITGGAVDTSTLVKIAPGVGTLTYAATVDLAFPTTTTQLKTLSLTGNVTFTTSAKAAGRSMSIRIISDGSPRNLTFPVGWIFIGNTAPTSIAASKTAVLSIVSWSTDDANVVAAYSVQP